VQILSLAAVVFEFSTILWFFYKKIT